jgi:cytochrome c oxidase cbb3-type subunit 1
MTVNPRVNPKKLRPYDEPPRRRRRLIPDGPDSAATGFLVASVVWFLVAAGIGSLALALRVMPFELSFPFGIFDLGFELTADRADAAFVNATVYGWLTNAGFAALAFMTPRLLGRPLVAEQGLNLALAIWNLSLLGGIAALYVFDPGPNAALTAFPWLIDGGLAFAALIVTGAFLATAGTAVRSAYVSIWFAGVALLALLGLLGLNATMGLLDFVIDLPDLTVALGSAFIERATGLLWLLGMAYAVLHYVVPRATGRPLESAGLAMLAWVTWLALAPLACLAVLVDTSVPFVVTTIGGVGAMLLLLPAALTLVNLALSLQGRWSLLFGTGPLAFAAVAAAFLFGTGLLEAIGALRSVRALVGGTAWESGLFVWTALGTFTFAALAMGQHALPRLLRRSWGGGPLAGAQLWLVFGGVTLAGLALMGAGMAEGSLRAQAASPEAIDAALLGYRAGALGGMAIAAAGSLAAILDVFLAYTSGEPADYVVPGAPATAAAGH